MVGHNDKVVQLKFALVAIVKEDINEKVGGGRVMKQRPSLGCDGGDEEGTLHVRIVGLRMAKE